MDSFNPNDPVWKLLGKARPVEPRTDFVQNVVRAARNTPQERSWWPVVLASVGSWLAGLQRPALVAVAAAVLVTLTTLWFEQPAVEQPVVAVAPGVSTAQAVADEDLALIASDMNIPLDGINHMDALVAMDDTSALTDTEIAFLLY
jgi:CheY-like chemotaxis protein